MNSTTSGPPAFGTVPGSAPQVSPATERQRQLVAAANALRTWVHDQRTAWENQPRRLSPTVMAAIRPAIEPVQTPRVTPTIALAPLSPPPPVAPVHEAERIVVNAVRPVSAAPGRSLWANPTLRWAVGGGLAVVVAAAVAYPALAGRRGRAATTVPAAPKVGTAVLATIPPGSDVFIDGSPAGKTPLTEELSAGIHHVEFRRRNSSRKLNIEVVEGQSTVEALDWTGKRDGSLEILTDPSGSSVTVDGVARGVTPLTIDDLSEGEHTVVLDSDRGSISRTVTIAPDAPSQIAESTRSGWLHVSAPVDVLVSEGSRSASLDERNQLLLSPGQHELLFENPTFGYHERRRFTIKTAAVTSIALVPPPSLLSITATLPAEVFIDGTSVGKTPLKDYAISIGNREVVVKSVTGAERRFTLTATVRPTSLEVDFSRR